jgi:hypothetical protein
VPIVVNAIKFNAHGALIVLAKKCYEEKLTIKLSARNTVDKGAEHVDKM